MHIDEAELRVGHFFVGSEIVKSLLLLMEGPGLWCVHFKNIQSLSVESGNYLLTKKRIKKHIRKCDWCLHVYWYFQLLQQELTAAYHFDHLATSFLLKTKIYPDITLGDREFLQKLEKAWKEL